jgi:hypothetical protein
LEKNVLIVGKLVLITKIQIKTMIAVKDKAC